MIQKYLVHLTKAKIQIDEDEVGKVLRGIEVGSVVVVRQGIIHPSYFVAIVRDDARIKEYHSENEYKRGEQIKPIGNLIDIFEGISEIKKLN